MIVITGPGRSGTSVLAQIYKELGVDPGGEWEEDLNAGLEATDAVELNDRIAFDLSLTMLEPPRERHNLHHYVGDGAAAKIKAFVPAPIRFKLHKRWDTLPWRQARMLHLLDWSRVEEVAAEHKSDMQDVAARHQLAKDPRFSWTLPVWFAADADISDVIITTRALEAMLASRREARLISIASENDSKNALTYAVGMSITSCLDNGIDPVMLRFPDFLKSLDTLHSRLPILCDLPFEQFHAAVVKVAKPGMVHH